MVIELIHHLKLKKMSRDEVIKIVTKTVAKAKKTGDFKILKKFLIDALTTDADKTVAEMGKYSLKK